MKIYFLLFICLYFTSVILSAPATTTKKTTTKIATKTATKTTTKPAPKSVKPVTVKTTTTKAPIIFFQGGELWISNQPWDFSNKK